MSRARLPLVLRRSRLALVVLVAAASTGCGVAGLTAPEQGCDPRDPRDRDWIGESAGPGAAGEMPFCQPTSR